MAVDIQQLVEIDLEPVFTLDTTIQVTIPNRIDAEVALQGWELTSLDDAQRVYIALRVTKSYITRLLLKFSQEIQEAKGGKAETKFAKAIDFLEELRKDINERIQAAAKEVDPEDVVGPAIPWPGVGIVKWPDAT